MRKGLLYPSFPGSSAWHSVRRAAPPLVETRPREQENDLIKFPKPHSLRSLQGCRQWHSGCHDHEQLKMLCGWVPAGVRKWTKLDSGQCARLNTPLPFQKVYRDLSPSTVKNSTKPILYKASVHSVCLEGSREQLRASLLLRQRALTTAAAALTLHPGRMVSPCSGQPGRQHSCGL